MFGILRDRSYRTLFAAQVVALLGTGLATVALGLLAWELAGEGAAMVLGTAFAIKMVAYVCIAPVAAALAERLDRRPVLVALDLVRAGVALCLPFVTEVWQVYGLIFALQVASAGFTPMFQATIPEVLPDEARYTRALSLSRLAYDLENIASPMLAGLLLMVVGFDVLFLGTALGFAGSAALVLSVALPKPRPAAPRGVFRRSTRGIRIYLGTPRLRGLLALSLAVSAGGAMVLVNTVVLVREELGLPDSALAWTLFAFGAGSMAAAMVLPRLLDRLADRPVMLTGAGVMVAGLLGLALAILVGGWGWPALLTAWLVVGLGYATVQTPSGRLLRRSSRSEDRPALFAAHFALSHACWLLCYPLAGWLMTAFGAVPALLVLAGLAGTGGLLALRLWPAADPVRLTHSHGDLPADHPHLGDGPLHCHAFVIDDLHPRWPGRTEEPK